MVIAIFEWQKIRHELSLMKDFLVPNSPSVTPLHKCNFAVLQSKIAAVGSKAKFHI